ncbi:MAG: cob(I)yrinic acid a,c-diamide adenosyltransferase [Fuerstiella sp.]|jgi:cob(I)alamin adenosyltransferase|nr:cob(I)yrinic acid a,c-diamide adenosyltransferase [Fuerstiella sp.]MCP4505539.1 cob(I)yrinic acid a,c-diamide adenosyltransferase [Fuerstiella sp.]MDG2130490.1 cob(I)yrinic acid a,c-diamide adenosyltransferase [Fuerstiella sp.]
MVILNRIYTRTGDGGETGIGDGSRVSKLDTRIVAGGSVDETNSHVGVAVTLCSDSATRTALQKIQQCLFDLGADISCPWNAEAPRDNCPRITEALVAGLESELDRLNQHLAPLQSFVLPGGSPLAAALHVARSVCRRTELDVLKLQQTTDINPQVVIYLNRLSDLLFVLARTANNDGEEDVLWIPAG